MSDESNWRLAASREWAALHGEPGAPKLAVDKDQSWSVLAPPEDLFGLALSGGGIRSATFNLGLLQGLHRLKILEGFDYLSTVSGGGYLGGFLSAWLSRSDHHGFPVDQAGKEAAEIRHLREFSNFLCPRLSTLSMETGRMAATFIATILPSALTALTVLGLALATWLGLAWLFLSEPAGRWPGIWLGLTTLLLQATFELSWLKDPHEESSQGTASFVLWALLSSWIAGASWAVLFWRVVPLPFALLLRPTPLVEIRSCFATALFPALPWAVAALVLVAFRSLLSRFFAQGVDWRIGRDALDRCLARVLFCLAFWVLGGTIWGFAQALASEGLSGILATLGAGAAGGGTFSLARKLVGATARSGAQSAFTRLRLSLLHLLAFATLMAIVLGVATLLVLLATWLGKDALFWAIGAFALILAIFLTTFEPHETGLHAFYRARLTRAYLGASNPGAEPHATSECMGDDLLLKDLPSRPFHLICCAANNLSGDPLVSLNRGAESAVLSKLGLQVGDHWHRWQKDRRRESPWLSSALTASAAAFNSQMGTVSVHLGGAATFLLAALNLRLGLWLENPGGSGSGLQWRRKLQRLFKGFLFLRELFGLSDAKTSWLYLSDGGHFENLALYELIRRHCRYVLVSDCGADPTVSFTDLANAIRRVREDFGVEIQIDPTPLRPGPNGLASQPMVAGTIKYSETDLGILLYVKPTLVGEEPVDVTQYRADHPTFPHETTIDQFFDEAQWESYRSLGEHIAHRAFGDLIPSRAARLFVKARYAWISTGSDEPGVLTVLEHAWAELEERVEKEPLLHGQFLPEPTADATSESLPLALPLLMESMRLMEAVYLRTAFGASDLSANHPHYRGWLNRFGRWASSPPFRAWWRWLAPLYSQPFIGFLQKRFQLPELSDCKKGQVRDLQPKDKTQSTWKRWVALRKEPSPLESSEVYGFFLPLSTGAAQEPELLAALVAIKTLEGDGCKTATWNRDEFFVPPGLWGVGIGEAFLDQLLKFLAPDFQRVRVTVEGSTVAWDAVYPGAGFTRSSEGFERSLVSLAPPDSGVGSPPRIAPPAPPAHPDEHPRAA